MRHLICRSAAAALAVCLAVAVPVGSALADGTPPAPAPSPAPPGAPAPAATEAPAPAATDGPAPAVATDVPGPAAMDSPAPLATDSPAPAATDAPAPAATETPAPAATDGPGPAATDATDDAAAAVMLDNSAVSVNTTDNSSVFHLAFTVMRSSGPDVSVSNVALAVTDCSHCRSVAISIQVAFEWPVPSALTATNVSLAVTSGCTACDAFAAALQYVIASKDQVSLTAQARSEVERAESQLSALQSPGLSASELNASITRVADQLGNALATGIVIAPDGDNAAVQDPPPLVVGSTLPLGIVLPPNVGAYAAVPSVGTMSVPSHDGTHEPPPPASPAPATDAVGKLPVPTSSLGDSGAITGSVVHPTVEPAVAPRGTIATVATKLSALGTGATRFAGPSIAVDPSTGLLPGAQVTVAGAGFPARAAVQVDECELSAAEILDPSRCSPIANSLLLTGTDGTVRGTATVVSGALGSAPGAGCPAAPSATCALALVAVGSSPAEADAPIAFAPTVPLPLEAAPEAASAPERGGRSAAPMSHGNASLAAAVRHPGESSRHYALGLLALILVGALAGALRSSTASTTT